ncbi:MAG: SDR family oxidoreductase [Verrucomicrobiota bacterium]
MKRPTLTLAAGAALGAWVLQRTLRSRYSFRGKVAVISGGSRGLGLVLARQLAKKGARLCLLARDEAELARARQDLVATGAEVLTVRCDLTERDQITAALQETIERLHGVDLLINNAGVIEVGPLAHMTREDFERSMAVHFWAPYELCMQIRPHMRRRGGGRIVNIASIGGKMAVPHLAPYCAGKFALTGFSDSIRAELARENIIVTTVAPGMMRTGSHVNARFKGEHGAEYAWFAFSNGLPGLSMSAERAAAKILAAAARGQPSLILTFAARFAVAGSALAPNLAGYAMRLVNRLLPAPGDASGNILRTGWESRARGSGRSNAHVDKAIDRNNERSGCK